MGNESFFLKLEISDDRSNRQKDMSYLKFHFLKFWVVLISNMSSLYL
jgi:hypothetical protein